MAKINNYILVCGGTGCRASRSEEIIAALRRALDRTGESERTRVIRTGCFGFCEQGPIVKMIPDNTFYVSVKPEDAEEIVREHVVKGRKVERLLYTAPDTGQHVPDSKHMKFYKPQLRIALRNCGFIDPENIGEYIARDGYAALAKVLGMQPDHVLQEIIDSGLRGRGGGGFPTGLKWKITRDAKADRKYVVCNADEGDPGAFMDRSILEGDPHSILEAMAINGYCTGASHGLIYIRAEYPLAIERLRRLRLRRGDGADSFDGRQTRRTDRETPVPERIGLQGLPDQCEQRRNLRQYSAHHPAGRRMVLLDRHRKEQGHQSLRPGGQGQ